MVQYICRPCAFTETLYISFRKCVLQC